MIGKAINKIPHKFRLRTTLVVPFVLQILAAVGVVGYLSFLNSERAVNDLAEQLQREISSRVNERVQVYLETPHLVNQINEDAARLGPLDFNDLGSSRSYLWKQVLRFKSIGYAGLANEKGQYLRVGWVNRWVSSEQPQLAAQLEPGTGDLNFYNLDQNGNPIRVVKTTHHYDVRKRPFYTAVLKNRQAAWSDIYLNFGYDSLQINASSPYYDRKGNLIGILTCQMGLDQIRGFLQTLQVGKSGQVFLVEPSGALIATSLANQPLTVGTGEAKKQLRAQDSSNLVMRRSMEYLQTRLKDLHTLQAATRLDFQLNGQRQFLEVSPLRDQYGLNWLIVVVVPEADFMAQINANTRNTALLCLGALGLAIALGIPTSRWVTRPVLGISQAANKLAQGNLDQQVAPSPITEIDTLAMSFNSMAGQLKESFDALRQSEATNRAIVTTATNRAIVTTIPDLMIRAKGDGTYLEIVGHDRLQGIHGVKRFSTGSTVHESLLPDLANLRMHHIQKALTTGDLQVYEQRLTINGQPQDEEVRILVLGEDEVLIMVRDITARKRAEEALRIAEENYRSIFENAVEGIFQSSPEGQFINANSALARIYGYDSPSEMIEQITDIGEQLYVDPEKRAEFKELLGKQNTVKDFEYRCYCKDSSIIWTQIDARAVRDSSSKLLYYEGIVQDITERKRREDELRRQLEELKIEIDQKKREKEVAMLTESSYFQEIQQEMAEVNLDEFWS